MTKPVFYGEKLTPHGIWMHEEPELDSKTYKLNIQNIDYVHYGYGDPASIKIMLVEEKIYGGEPDWAQKAVFTVIHCAFRYLVDGKRVKDIFGNQRTIHYLGCHLLQFENTCIKDGGASWNRTSIDRDTLIKVLRFEVDPRSIAKRN